MNDAGGGANLLLDGAHCAALEGDVDRAIDMCRGVIAEHPNTDESNQALQYLTTRDTESFTKTNPDRSMLDAYRTRKKGIRQEVTSPPAKEWRQTRAPKAHAENDYARTSRKTSSQSFSEAKTGAYIGCIAYVVTHFIPVSGYKHVLGWMHSAVMSVLNVTPNKISGSPENVTGAIIYVLGWGLFAALGAVVGALVGSRSRDRHLTAEESEEPATSTNSPYFGRSAQATAFLKAEGEAPENTPSTGVTTESVDNSDSAASSISPQPAEKAEPRSTAVGDALGAGAVGGATAGLAAHYLAAGTLTFPIFIVAYVLMLSHLKGSGWFLALVSFAITGGLVVAIMENLAG